MNMQNRVVSLLIRSVMAVLLGIGLALLLNTKSVAGDVKLDQIKTKTDLYQNVTVTGHNKTDIFITHSMGMANIKISELDPETLWRVGLGEKPLEPGSPEALAAAQASQIQMPAALAKMLETSSASAPEGTEGQTDQQTANLAALPLMLNSFQPGSEQFQSLLPFIVGVLAISLAIYLFFCYCLKLIVQKTGTKAGALIWLPVLQLIPMLRAAGMSMLWFFFWISPMVVVALMPIVFLRGGDPEQVMKLIQTLSLAATITSLLQLIAALVWCVKIVQARGKSLWVTLFLILPFTNLFAFLYLAFSSSDYDEEVEESNSDKIVIEPVFGDA